MTRGCVDFVYVFKKTKRQKTERFTFKSMFSFVTVGVMGFNVHLSFL